MGQNDQTIDEQNPKGIFNENNNISDIKNDKLENSDNVDDDLKLPFDSPDKNIDSSNDQPLENQKEDLGNILNEGNTLGVAKNKRGARKSVLNEDLYKDLAD